jgi:hypothetical protein
MSPICSSRGAGLKSAGITKRLWEMSDIVDVLEAWESAQI